MALVPVKNVIRNLVYSEDVVRPSVLKRRADQELPKAMQMDISDLAIANCKAVFDRFLTPMLVGKKMFGLDDTKSPILINDELFKASDLYMQAEAVRKTIIFMSKQRPVGFNDALFLIKKLENAEVRDWNGVNFYFVKLQAEMEAELIARYAMQGRA